MRDPNFGHQLLPCDQESRQNRNHIRRQLEAEKEKATMILRLLKVSTISNKNI